MIYKKTASILIAGALIAAMGVTSAFAAASTQSYPVCTVSGCTLTDVHQHDGITCAAHSVNNGHTYHSSCSLSGCDQSGAHASHSGGHHSHKSGGHHG